MKRAKLSLLLVTLAVATAAVPAQAQGTLQELLNTVRNERQQTSAEQQARLRQFRDNLQQQQALLSDAKSKLAAQEARTNSLKARFDANELELTEMQSTLDIRIGDMGELFGVVRQNAGDLRGVVYSSLVSAQYPDRLALVDKLAATTGVPSIDDLHSLRVLMQEEMTEYSNVTRFQGGIVRPDGKTTTGDVVRVGAFNLISGDKFLKYEADEKGGSIVELARQPAGYHRSDAGALAGAAAGSTTRMSVDPTSGVLLGLEIQRPDPKERIDQGGVVGYVILSLGLIGLLIALVRIAYLVIVGAKIRSQLKSTTPNTGNALGRIMNVYHQNESIDTETLELKLDESILKETPKLEKWQGAIKLIAAVAPLLGLLGTVTGMIETFQQITLFGTGDPKLMASGISEALVTTMLGLFVAIPMVFLHSIVAAAARV